LAPHDCVNAPHGQQNLHTCWGDSAYQICPENRQGAYDLVQKAVSKDGGQAESYAVYQKLLADGSAGGVTCTKKEAPHDCVNAPHGQQNLRTCWGDSAFQICPENRQGAYDLVQKAVSKDGDQAKAYAVYQKLLADGSAGGVTCTKKTYCLPRGEWTSDKCVRGETRRERRGGRSPPATLWCLYLLSIQSLCWVNHHLF